MRNQQPMEKPVLRGSQHHLDVQSIFHTIQGEGPFAGVPAVFIRLAGCNLQCPGCDTDYTSKRKMMAVEEILAEVKRVKEPETILVVITGGEPFRQPLGGLIEALLAKFYAVQLETNGSLYQDLPYDHITVVCSPKTGSIHPQLEPHLDALKYVLDAKDVGDDGLPDRALDHGTSRLARPGVMFAGTVYVQPYDPGGPLTNDIHHQAVVASCLKHGYTLCLQTHKFLGLD
jgi:organic radical activating enzyme